MKLTRSYINLEFTYKNVCYELYDFWMKHVMTFKGQKIWLTIRVNISNNTSFTLIKNLPFNTADYNDVYIVLEERLRNSLLISRADRLNSITFSYNIVDNEAIKKTSFLKINRINIFILILLFTVWISLFLLDSNSPISFIEEEPIYIFNEEKSNINTSRCIFSPFIELFSKSHPSYNYFPSHFVANDVMLNINSKPLSLSEHIIYKQYLMLDGLLAITYEHVGILSDILKEYSDIPPLSVPI